MLEASLNHKLFSYLYKAMSSANNLTILVETVIKDYKPTSQDIEAYVHCINDNTCTMMNTLDKSRLTSTFQVKMFSH